MPGDLILVTHHHGDHVNKALVEKLAGEDALIMAPLKCEHKLGMGMSTVRAGELIPLSDLEIKVVHAYNPPGSRSITYHKKDECVGYVLGIGGKRIYHSGDTRLIDEMGGLGDIDLALLPIGGKFTMDVDEAVEAVKRIKPREVVPMHMLKADPQVFKRLVESRTEAKVRVLRPGEAMNLD